MNVDRRNFLKGAGVAIALPLLEPMPALRAAQKAAKSAGPGKRFVCLSNNNGIYKKGFFPAAAGTDYALPPTLNPLERHRRDFTVFSNLDHGNTGGHQGVPVLLSGVRPHLAAARQARQNAAGEGWAIPVLSRPQNGADAVEAGRCVFR